MRVYEEPDDVSRILEYLEQRFDEVYPYLRIQEEFPDHLPWVFNTEGLVVEGRCLTYQQGNVVRGFWLKTTPDSAWYVDGCSILLTVKGLFGDDWEFSLS